MIYVAHNINTPNEAEIATKSDCNLLEVDISQNIFTSNFVIQHDGLKGKLGIGYKLDDLINSDYKENLILDLKLAKYSINYERKIDELLKRLRIKNLRLTALDLEISSRIAEQNNAEIYYGILNEKSLKKAFRLASALYNPNFSIKHKLIDKNLIKTLKTKFPQCKIIAWTVNDMAETKRLMKMEIDGIITDNWESLLRYK